MLKRVVVGLGIMITSPAKVLATAGGSGEPSSPPVTFIGDPPEECSTKDPSKEPKVLRPSTDGASCTRVDERPSRDGGSRVSRTRRPSRDGLRSGCAELRPSTDAPSCTCTARRPARDEPPREAKTLRPSTDGAPCDRKRANSSATSAGRP